MPLRQIGRFLPIHFDWGHGSDGFPWTDATCRGFSNHVSSIDPDVSFVETNPCRPTRTPFSCHLEATAVKEDLTKTMASPRAKIAKKPMKNARDVENRMVEDEDERDEHGTSTSETESEQERRPSDGGQAALARAFSKVVQREDQGKFADLKAYTETIKSKRKIQGMELEEEEAQGTRKKRERLEWKKRGRIYPKKAGEDPKADQKERHLRKIATRGVVTLFNAVAKAQKTVEDNKNKPNTAAALTKATFLAEIKGGLSHESEPKAKGNAPDKGGWNVLHDNYGGLGTGKLKDLEKQQEDDTMEGLDSDLLDTASESSGHDSATDGSPGASEESELEEEETEAEYESE